MLMLEQSRSSGEEGGRVDTQSSAQFHALTSSSLTSRSTFCPFPAPIHKYVKTQDVIQTSLRLQDETHIKGFHVVLALLAPPPPLI